tara:strand:+ start:108 stop:233 length:126 start_codon:yes stop_codon:yes gene_type:complete
MIIFINDQSDIPVVDIEHRRKKKKAVTVLVCRAFLAGFYDV